MLERELPFDLSKGLDGKLQILTAVRCAHLGTNASRALRDDRIKKADNVNTLSQHPRRESLRERSIAEHHRYDGMNPRFNG